MKSDLRPLGLALCASALAFSCLIPARTVAQDAPAPTTAQSAAPSTASDEQAATQRRSKEAAEKRAAATKAAEAMPTPRLADGHPDLSGVWGGGQGLGTVHKDADGTTHVIFPAREAPKSVDPDGKLVEYYLQVDGDRARANNKNKPPYKEEVMAKVTQLDKGENQMDPVVSCHPAGVPRSGTPTQSIAGIGYVVFLYTGENSGHYRIISTNGGDHAPGAFDTYFGDSVGHWEGDTLVVDVTNLNDKTWLGSDGWFHSNKMHVVEKYTRVGNALHYQSTVEDPEVFTKSWSQGARTILINNDANNYVFEDLPCMDFDQAHFVNHDHF
jgi:hypothetical protein